MFKLFSETVGLNAPKHYPKSSETHLKTVVSNITKFWGVFLDPFSKIDTHAEPRGACKIK